MTNTVFDPLLRDIVLCEIIDIAQSLDFVALYLGNQDPKLNSEAERIQQNLRGYILDFQNDVGVQRYLSEVCAKEWGQIDFVSYLSSIEDAKRSGDCLDGIIGEMNSSISRIIGALHGRPSKDLPYRDSKKAPQFNH